MFWHIWLFAAPCPGLLCSWKFPSKTTGVCCHFLLQGSNPCLLPLLQWPADSLSLVPPGNPWGFQDCPGGSDSKEPTCHCRKPRFDPWVRKIPWRRAWLPGYSSTPMDKGAWWATVHGVSDSGTRLSNFHFVCLQITQDPCLNTFSASTSFQEFPRMTMP